MFLKTVAFSCTLALIAVLVLIRFTRKAPDGTDEMKRFSGLIHHGAITYLNTQYRVLIILVAVVAVVLAFAIGMQSAVVFVAGALCSMLAGNIGLRVATRSNAKTTNACRKSVESGLHVAFSAGSVMGLLVVIVGLVGVSFFYTVFGNVNILFSFGFGASLVALFSRVGGGIYTKAADVGADMVGKVEHRIPEDDPRNPAVIADNVGDNVGDIAGMGADLFESYVDAIIAAMAVAMLFSGPYIQLPLILASAGIVSSIAGIIFILSGKGNIEKLLNRGIFLSTGIMIIASYFIIDYLGIDITIVYCITAGLISGVVIGLSAEYYTSREKEPVRRIAESSETGPATVIISGLSVGMVSTFIPALSVCTAILISYYFMGLYGVSIAAVGMLSTLGIILATDSYGPIADNAAGIAEMAKSGKKVRENAETLDAVGNTTAAINKGFAIGSAALTTLALFSVYGTTVGLTVISIMDPFVIVGLILGGLLPFLFSAYTMNAVGKTAVQMVKEVRKQFKKKGVIEGTVAPDYDSPIRISTQAAIREMIKPGILAVAAPLLVGLLLGVEALGGLLAGAILTGFLLSLMMANSGGAWDNAKKYIEEGNLGGKGSEAHAAAVVGDTIGDPFKDTSGPSLNILIKLMTIVALVFVPLFL
ncbi:MAG: sodium-translocating pyrophosphatase [Candidatus Aenigmarchaeota archaeon]|nr:sodium-translocating pyrophosphatase [Candidatus Aenigmarchaeota archaeon]